MGMHFNPYGGGGDGNRDEFPRKLIKSMNDAIDTLIDAARNELKGRIIDPYNEQDAVIVSTLIDLGMLKVLAAKSASIVEGMLSKNAAMGNVLIAVFLKQACDETKINEFLPEDHKIK